jgi:acetyl esterase/lipase
MMHGGGWINGSREDVARFVPPFTRRHYVVANIGYRTASEAKAPAAAEDIRNAVECLRSRASDWNADSDRMLLAGFSAGAHLAMLAALAPPEALGGPQSRPIGIVSFWGMTDLADLLDGENARDFARRWLPESHNRLEVARRLSPIQYSVADAPPLCAVHSVHDDVVPFVHSQRLVEKFQQANRPAKLIRLSHRGHAAPAEDYPMIFSQVFAFLATTGVGG